MSGLRRYSLRISSAGYMTASQKISARYVPAMVNPRSGCVLGELGTFGSCLPPRMELPLHLVDSLSLAFNVTHIGPWAGNAGSNPQPFNCGIDYFINTAAPITPEDGAYVADTQGPYIHGVRAVMQANAMMVIWKTDEPADGRLDYGTTTSYGSFRTHSYGLL